jgi:CubicO group peptidase (beta-lactamase class C family)
VLLGAIIERVSKTSYKEYVGREVFARAGMRGTGIFAVTELPEQRARRYTRFPTLRSPFTPGPRVEFPQQNDLPPGPHGGALSTAEDLGRFAQSLMQGRLMRRETLDPLTRPRKPGAWGRGFEAGGDGTTRYFGHQGGAPGANTFFRIYPELGYTVIVLSNTDNGAMLVGSHIAALLTR